ncbi:MAG TPA: hypothetical protein VLJ42_05940 [Solirubrobacteraceae bacterium]|nr:hypothetical protein [Solirubrobacteraceae bacterium]
MPFWISIGLLSVGQGAVVAMPRALRIPGLERLSGRGWAAVPALSVIGFVFGVRAATDGSAEGLTYLALVAVPLLAMVALGGLARGARPLLALVAVPLFVLAWADRSGLGGQAAACVLSGLSCVTLGVLLAAVTPARWLAVGIVLMAGADCVLVVSSLLQQPNDALNAAQPGAGLPQLQSESLGSAVMGYGDLFVAGAFGGLLAARGSYRVQWRAAALTAALALVFDCAFFLVDELPATVPVALALVILEISSRYRRRAGRRAVQLPVGVRPPGRVRAPRAGGYTEKTPSR